MTDDQAVLRCQDGEREAFRHLVDEYKDVLYGTALLMIRNPALAEEQVQEAFLAAWRGIQGFQRGRPFKPWLVRILVNRIVSLRRTRALPTVPLQDHDSPEDLPHPAEAMQAQLDRQVIRQALTGLAPDHREVIVLALLRRSDGPGAGRNDRRAFGDSQVQAAPGAGPTTRSTNNRG